MFKKIRWLLVFYDALIFILSALLLFVLFPKGFNTMEAAMETSKAFICFLCLFSIRMAFSIYNLIWRYASVKQYILLIISDAIACFLFLVLHLLFNSDIVIVQTVCLFMLNLLLCVFARLLYQLIYQNRNIDSKIEKFTLKAVKFLTNRSFDKESSNRNRIRIAIVGAGNVGTMLANDLLHNPMSTYVPVCFVDSNKEKVGGIIYGIPVIAEDEKLAKNLNALSVHEVVFALPNIKGDKRLELYATYTDLGYKVMTYDFPVLSTDNNGKRQLREFDVEDLLFRNSRHLLNKKTMSFYKDKCVLITGGGGSIGSELARQVARCNPTGLVILDEYENGAYDIQQELKMRYGDELNLDVEIASITDKEQVDTIVKKYKPDIIFHAAAHKHVPLMEHNVVEAIKNNVFGTLNVVEASEKYNVKRFIMISTDKAVNPTNVMGATKRMCEMIVQSRTGNKTLFSATRFGNVLGSNGSVIPLFKKQIANGGPITITDKNIIRYFMTITEASQLVMTSGAMAKNGELYVLDMGLPVKIIDLAENMIRLSGLEPYKDIDIVEIGLRPGEKLYEELLINKEEQEKTDNSLIFIEKDKPLTKKVVEEKLAILTNAVSTNNEKKALQALREVVPTYKKVIN